MTLMWLVCDWCVRCCDTRGVVLGRRGKGSKGDSSPHSPKISVMQEVAKPRTVHTDNSDRLAM